MVLINVLFSEKMGYCLGNDLTVGEGGGGGVPNQKTFHEGWIFSGTTHCCSKYYHFVKGLGNFC